MLPILNQEEVACVCVCVCVCMCIYNYKNKLLSRISAVRLRLQKLNLQMCSPYLLFSPFDHKKISTKMLLIHKSTTTKNVVLQNNWLDYSYAYSM